MPRHATNSLGKLGQDANGYYRRAFGKRRHGDGRMTPFTVTFTRDAAESYFRASVWFAFYQAHLERDPGFVWTNEQIRKTDANIDIERRIRMAGFVQADKVAREAYSRATTTATMFAGSQGYQPPELENWQRVRRDEQSHEQPEADTDAGESFNDALTAYEQFVETDAEISNPTRRRTLECTRSLRKRAAKMEPPFDIHQPMQRVSSTELERLTMYLKSRPISKKTGNKISADTVRTELQKWHGAFDWIDSHESRFGWIWPRRAEELFTLDMTKLMSKAEKDAVQNGDNVIVPTHHEVVAYLRAATDEQRAQILTAIFGAEGQTELSVTARTEFDLGDNRLTHNRNKTSVRGVYFVPPELVKLLQDIWSRTPGQRLAFVTTKGTPIVTDTSDSVRQWFDDLRRKVIAQETARGVCGARRELSFYDFRRVLANYPEVQQKHLIETALSQTHKTVGRKRYVPNRDVQHAELWPISQRLYAELKNAGAFDWP